jgi:hypothetical protein
MVLPSSGALDYSSIRGEFGAPSSNVYLNLFYRTGPYTYNVPANSNITTSGSGQLSVSNFYGARSKTDYAAGPGGTHSTGGKLPNQYYGTGGPSLPGMSDTSASTNTGNKTINAVYTTNIQLFPTSIQLIIQSGGPGSHSSPMNCYRNDNGSNVDTWTMSNGTWSGPSNQVTWIQNIPSQSTALNTATLNIYRFF